MFEFLKSTQRLEKELREWLVADMLRGLGEADRQFAVDQVSMLDERQVAIEVASIVMTLRAQGDVSRQFGGTIQPLSEGLHWMKGLRLVNAFTKAKHWHLECEGSAGLGYICTIK